MLLALEIGGVLAVLLVVCANVSVARTSAESLYSEIDEVPYNRVGLLLGTSRYLGGGEPNPYFDNRIDAASALFGAGKVSFIVASGDNAHHSYNEPVVMQRELMRRGVPEEAIYLDYAGFSTLDSVVRANRVFGQKSFTVISQRFHNERALYIANHYSLRAVGFNAAPVAGVGSLRTTVREYFARVKAVLDVHVFSTQPRFLGNEVSIP